MGSADDSRRVVADRYALGRCLGRGGMGTVWLATDRLLDREVAVKEITFPLSISDHERWSLRERTLREARAAARFEHARATTVYDVVEEDGRPWIVMEHVPSRSLSEVLEANGPLPVVRVAQIGLDVLAALSAAHRAGIVHRDVKPANVLVSSEGRAWLTDFGIATSSGDQRLTGQHVLLGSPAYIAPERARGEEPGPAADLWSLGATLFTAVGGRAPFERGEAMATLMAAASEEPPAVPQAGPLQPLLRALLVREPERRATAEQARAELQGALRPGPASAPPPPLLTSAPRDDREQVAGAPVGSTSAAVQRLDVKELSALAAAASRALAGSAVREVTRRAARRSDERRTSAPASAPVGSKGTRSIHPSAQPFRRSSQPARRPAWRFKRRWVGVPLLLLLLLLLAVVGLVGLAGAALLGGG